MGRTWETRLLLLVSSDPMAKEEENLTDRPIKDDWRTVIARSTVQVTISMREDLQKKIIHLLHLTSISILS